MTYGDAPSSTSGGKMKTKTARLMAVLAVIAFIVPMLAAGYNVQTGLASKAPESMLY
jgi:hypothetical protein